MTTTTLNPLSVYDEALVHASSGRSARLVLQDDLGGRTVVDTAPWCRSRLPGDTGLLARCAGPTLDVGCGPGRLTAALNRLGHPALGIDVSPAAIRLARRRGATALRRDVFGPLPGHGRWRHALLADGNIGIGGDPVALLSRCRDLLARRGRLHVELAPPGTRSWSGAAALSHPDQDSPPARFRWAVVAAPDLTTQARAAGLRTLDSWTEAGRWFTTLTRA
ncbi:class I SAM-dependent methyltransferase [Micromonosporaceae bacterium Da 78-11]